MHSKIEQVFEELKVLPQFVGLDARQRLSSSCGHVLIDRTLDTVMITLHKPSASGKVQDGHHGEND